MSETHCTTQTEILEAATLGLPWRGTVVYLGHTAKGNTSRKFWSISAIGKGPVTVRWGRVGNKAQTKKTPSTLGEALGKLGEKLGKGYVSDIPATA